MSSASFSPGSTRRHHRSVMWLGVWTLLLSLFTPVVSLQAVDAATAAAERAALGDEIQCDEDQVLDDQSGECVPEGDGPPAELQQQDQGQQDQLCPEGQTRNPGTGECVPVGPPECPDGSTFDPNQNACVPDQPEEQPSGVQLDKLTCPPGTDWYQASYQELDSGCPANQQPITFTHTDPKGQNTAVQVTSGYEWSPTEAGYHSTTEKIPEGYGTPIVWCGSYVPQQTSPTLNPTELQNGVTVGWQLQPNEWLYCKWFNIPTGDGENSITVYKWECVPGTEYGQDQNYYQGEDQDVGPCESEHLNIPISLIDGNGPHDTTTQANGTEWDGVVLDQAGSFQVTVDEPDGFGEPMVFCGTLDDEEQQPVPATDGAITLTPATQPFTIQCNWYNIPAGNEILIIKHWCPPGLAFTQPPTYDDLDAACNDEGSGAMFELEGPEGAPQVWPPQSPQGDPLIAGWQGVPPGDYIVSESGLDDTWTSQVFCLNLPSGTVVRTGDDTSTSLARTLDPPPVELNDSGGLEVTVADGASWYCSWFNIASEPITPLDASENSVTVYKWECVPGTEYGQDQNYYQGEDQDVGPCESEHLNIPISLIDGNGPHDTTTQANGTEWDGVVLDQAGSFQVTVDEPDGFGDPMVFCGTLDEDAQSPVSATGGSITITPGSEPFTYQCNWYDIPDDGDDGNTITVYKWECVPGTEYGQDQGYYQGEDQDVGPCETEHLGVTITLVDANGQHEMQTQANGTQWNDVTIGQEGELQLIEDIPDGFSEPVVFCWTGDGDPQKVASDDGFVIPSPDTSEQPWDYFCNWYNIPTTTGGSTITLQKYSCDPGTPRDTDPSELAQNCALHDGVTFTLEYGDTSVPATTNDQGNASWNGVPVGPWSVQEDVPEGYGEPIVYCLYTDWPAGVADADESSQLTDASDGRFNGEFKYDNMQVFCGVFNFELETSWIDITKWWCSEDVTTPYQQSVDNLLESCERYTEGVEFTLQYGDQSVPMTTDGDGNAEWSGVPSGQWAMHETIPDGYGDPVVYCRWIEWPDGVEINTDPFNVGAPSGSFAGDFKYGGMRLHCDIFNIPDYEPGQITIFKWYCPEGVPRDTDPNELQNLCDFVTTGVNFRAISGETSQPLTTNSFGVATWDNVPPGNWEIQEQENLGYGPPVIRCQYVDWPEDADVNGDLFTPDLTGFAISGSFDYPGLRLVCYWFNFPHDDGDNWVTIHKYLCPPNSEYPDDLEAYLEGCGDTPMDGASFELISEQYPSGSPKVTSGGLARWQELYNGGIRIQEALPEGYDPPKIWCTTYQPSDGLDAVPALDTFEKVDAPEGEWSRTIDDGGPYRIVCYVFNIPNEENTVTVHKYNCEYEPVGFHSLGEWLDACPTKGNDVGFTLDNSAGSQLLETVDGKATWTDVPLGEFTLTEEPQAGYGKQVVWCGWTAYYDGKIYDAFPQLVPADGGVYHGDITVPNTNWFCYWFNLPRDDSSITVYKYNCPEGSLDGVVTDELNWYQTTCTEEGNGIEFTLDNSEGAFTQEIMNGSTTWNDVPQGPFTLTESIPPGYGPPVWWCGSVGYEGGAIADGFPQKVDAPNGVFSASIDFDVTNYFCWVFNFPDRDHTVTVHKWYCPVGTEPGSKTYDEWSSTCTEPMSGVGFTHEDSSGSSWKLTGISGTATWYGAEPGDNSLTEQHLPGYEPPVVYCELDARYDDGAAYAEGLTPYTVTDNSVSKTLDYAEFHWTCHFFNIPKGPGEITIYKWYCPPGYDVNAWNADPKVDCTQSQNGIPFTLDQPVGPNLMSNTGDSVPGAVYFGDLDPGSYVVSETVPLDIGYVFVWDCVGGDIPKVHPMPLNWGNVLNVDVAGGDSITCHWYNVPDPEFGWITLYKYSCSTPTFTSEIDCQIYEFGASFELFQVDGNVSKGVGDTNAGGQYTWGTLEEGAYSLDEVSHKPCKVTSTKVDDKGNAWVDAGQGTVIKVYNCKVDTSTTPQVPGKVPGKYPNTGVGPSGGVLFPSMQQTPEPDETPIVAIDGTPTDPIEAAEQFYAISCLNEEPAAGGTPAPFVDEDASEEELPPFLQAPDDAEPTAEPTTAATGGTPATDAECVRGAVPKKLVINAANVNHDIEVVEIVDGVMQAPTGPNVVSWYKETARLGESNNMVIAGHLNWWNVPEGPFFALDTLEEGDRIEVTGEDGNTYVYEVQWVRQESNLEPPAVDVVGPTNEQALTLITCGGEWDSAVSEYNARTVARAVQVEVIEAETGEQAGAEGG